MTRHGRLRKLQYLHQVADTELAALQQMKNAQTNGIGKRTKKKVHTTNGV